MAAVHISSLPLEDDAQADPSLNQALKLKGDMLSRGLEYDTIA
jgi:hypothetical protein